MADTLTTITKLINSPPGVLAAGGVLAGIVWKFFERVEAVLTDNTRLEIAVWLRGVKVGQKVEPWPGTFAKLFDKVFGRKHLSWTCFWRSCLASHTVFAVAAVFATLLAGHHTEWNVNPLPVSLFVSTLFANAIPYYLSLLETRLFLALMVRSTHARVQILLLLADLLLTIYVGCLGAAFLAAWQQELVTPVQNRTLSAIPVQMIDAIAHPLILIQRGLSNEISFVTTAVPVHGEISPEFRQRFPHTTIVTTLIAEDVKIARPIIIGACATSLWLWLYAGAGFILKAARRFDIGFEWFNRKFDIEKKPLQSIGLVAGALVALVYWGAVIVSRVL